MIEADTYYGNSEFAESLRKVGRFLMISQLPPPQPGWAQQYNEFLQPAWARSFEPPSVCLSATVHNINSLIDLYLHTHRAELLEPIPDAIRWLKASRLPNGKWGRFLELGTNKPLYFDRGRIRVDLLQQLTLERRTGYGYENDIQNALDTAERRYLQVSGQLPEAAEPDREAVIKKLAEDARKIIDSQDEQGRWIVHKNIFRKEVPGELWNGEYRTEDRISSELFNRNVNNLCAFLDEFKNYTQK